MTDKHGGGSIQCFKFTKYHSFFSFSFFLYFFFSLYFTDKVDSLSRKYKVQKRGSIKSSGWPCPVPWGGIYFMNMKKTVPCVLVWIACWRGLIIQCSWNTVTWCSKILSMTKYMYLTHMCSARMIRWMCSGTRWIITCWAFWNKILHYMVVYILKRVCKQFERWFESKFGGKCTWLSFF